MVTVKKSCFNCKTVVNSGALCISCVSMIKDLYVERRLEANFYERIYSDLWNQCQRCQGSYFQEVICQNYDCPIFFKRLKTRKDLKELDEKLERFNEHIEW